jgi:MFS family permease
LAAAGLSMQRGTETQRTLIALAPAVLGVVLAIFALSRTLALSMALLVAIGACVMSCANSANVLLQQSVGDAWRGRVIGLYAMSFQGLAPVGTLLAGAMAAHIGLSATFLINGLIVGVAGLYARRRLAEYPDLFSGVAAEMKNEP